MSGNAPSPAVLTEAALATVFAEALAAFPNECCGWLTDEHARPCVNAQELGSEVGAIADRTAETAYVIAGDDLLAFNKAFREPSPPTVIYHSHPNGRAYFSATDRGVAVSPWGDGPNYPVQQLIVGVLDGRVVEYALYAWSDTDEDFVEVARQQVS